MVWLIKENINRSNKILKDIRNLDLDADTIKTAEEVVGYLKEFLLKNNSIGYLGAFTNILYNMLKWSKKSANDDSKVINRGAFKGSGDYELKFGPPKIKNASLISLFESLYERIQKNRDIISNLRDRKGKLIRVEDCELRGDLNDALMDLEEWRVVNNFMKKIPKQQRELIWRNNYIIDELWPNYRSICSDIKSIISKGRESSFLRKISSIKTKEGLLNYISGFGGVGIDWSYESYMELIKSDKNCKVTFDSPNIVVVKMEHPAVSKYCYDTAWCIKDKSLFNEYARKGEFFCVLNFGLMSNNRLSKVGLTIGNGKILHCQDKIDQSVDITSIGLGNLSVRLSKSDLNKYFGGGEGFFGRIKRWSNF